MSATPPKGNWARFGDAGYDALYAELQAGAAGREELDRLEEKLVELCPLHSPDLPAPKHRDPGRGQRLDHPALRRRRLRRSGGFPTGGKGRRLSAGRFYPPTVDRQEALSLMDRRGIPWRYCGETPAFKERPTQRAVGAGSKRFDRKALIRLGCGRGAASPSAARLFGTEPGELD